MPSNDDSDRGAAGRLHHVYDGHALLIRDVKDRCGQGTLVVLARVDDDEKREVLHRLDREFGTAFTWYRDEAIGHMAIAAHRELAGQRLIGQWAAVHTRGVASRGADESLP